MQQIALLRRIGEGAGLPDHVLRPPNSARDVELLGQHAFVESTSRDYVITLAGVEFLRSFDSAGSEERLAGLRVLHQRDQSISIERWPTDS